MEFIRKHKWKITIALSCVLVLSVAIAILVGILTKPEIDRFDHPGFGGEQSQGFMRIRMDEAVHSADEEIKLTINTAFCEDLEEAEGARKIEFSYWSSKVFDISYPGAERIDPSETVEADWVLEDDRYIMRLPNDSVRTKDLVYGVSNTFRKFARQALPYEFDLILTVKEDAPYECYGEIRLYFVCSGTGDLTDSYTWNDSFGQQARGILYFHKVGDTIYFYDESQAS